MHPDPSRVRGMVRLPFDGHTLLWQSCSQTASDEQKSLRFDLTPVGYRTIMSFPTGHPPSPHLTLAAKPSYGAAVGVRLDELNLIELRWARQDTHVHLNGSAPFSDKKVMLDQFHGDFTHEYILEEWHRWARPFVMGSVGATHVNGGTSSSFTRFSLRNRRWPQSLFHSSLWLEDAGGMVTTRGRA